MEQTVIKKDVSSFEVDSIIIRSENDVIMGSYTTFKNRKKELYVYIFCDLNQLFEFLKRENSSISKSILNDIYEKTKEEESFCIDIRKHSSNSFWNYSSPVSLIRIEKKGFGWKECYEFFKL